VAFCAVAILGCGGTPPVPDRDARVAARVPTGTPPNDENNNPGKLAPTEWSHGKKGGLSKSEGKPMDPTYTCREEVSVDGQAHFAEVTVRAWPVQSTTDVTLSAGVLDVLRSNFGQDFEHQRHNLWAAVIVTIESANVKGKMPRVGATSFHAEVVGLRLSANASRDASTFLLTSAGMRAMGEYLLAWEHSAAQ
jgi:hypothetical protein